MASFSPFYKLFVAIFALAALALTALAAAADLSLVQEDQAVPPFRLNVYNPKIQNFAAGFLTISGRAIAMNKKKDANLFKISSYGGLSTADEGQVTTYLSTSGNVKSMSWSMGPSLSNIYSGLSLTLMRHEEALTWKDKAFDRGKARSCQQGSTVLIIFKGSVPGNCTLVDLLAYRDK